MNINNNKFATINVVNIIRSWTTKYPPALLHISREIH